MQINIKTSASNQAIVSALTQKLPGGARENIIARVALGYSLASGKRFQRNEFNSYDSTPLLSLGRLFVLIIQLSSVIIVIAALLRIAPFAEFLLHYFS